MIADLHIHTTASDGRLSPEEVVDHAIKVGLSYIAITDHDTTDGLQRLKQQNKLLVSSLSIIPGIEFSTDLPHHEVHILGYYIHLENDKLQSQLSFLKEHRRTRGKKILDKLIHLGYSLNYEEILMAAGNATSIGRPHIAQALINKGYFSTTTEVFSLLLNVDAPAYVPHYKLTPKQVIDLIVYSGGIPVLAHPGLIKNDSVVLDMIKLGINGIEVYHPTHDLEQTKKYLSLAETHKLIITGGSDFHAIPGRFPESLGIFTIPADIVYTMKKTVNQ